MLDSLRRAPSLSPHVDTRPCLCTLLHAEKRGTIPPKLTEMALYGADKAVIVYILYSELYGIIILYNNTIIIPSISLLPHL
jgi:hypothetical protein